MHTWRTNAKCLGEEHSWFFPDNNNNQAQYFAELARNVCKQCKVVSECLEWSSDKKVYGIFGGKTEQEREELFMNKYKKGMQNEGY